MNKLSDSGIYRKLARDSGSRAPLLDPVFWLIKFLPFYFTGAFCVREKVLSKRSFDLKTDPPPPSPSVPLNGSMWIDLAILHELKGLCHAIFVYFQKLNGVFASIEFQK